jgi:hypothetical protein
VRCENLQRIFSLHLYTRTHRRVLSVGVKIKAFVGPPIIFKPNSIDLGALIFANWLSFGETLASQNWNVTREFQKIACPVNETKLYLVFRSFSVNFILKPLFNLKLFYLYLCYMIKS